MASTIRASYFNGAGPSSASAETGVKFNREDTQTGTTPIPIPSSTGTNYSWYKVLGLDVTSADATFISNRRIRMGSAPATGFYLYFKAVSTYTQATSGNKPTDNASTNGAVPSTYTLMTTSDQVYDSGSDSANSTGINGDYVQVVLGVGNNFAGGGGSNQSLPNLILTYDEQ